MNKILWLNISIVLCITNSYSGGWLDLSTLTDLTDAVDDRAAFIQAANTVGDGGTIYIPAGTMYLDSPVVLNNLSLTIYGDGPGITLIASRMTAGDDALTLMSDISNVGGCDWAMRQFSFVPDDAEQGGALVVKDQIGKGNGSTLSMTEVNVTSSTKDYFIHGVELQGLKDAFFESCLFVGELQDSEGEVPGKLTQTHIRITTKPCGIVTIADGHMRMVQNCIQLEKGCDSLKVRRSNMVQCEHGVWRGSSADLDHFIMMNCASQILYPMEVCGDELTHITTSRFKRDLVADENEYSVIVPLSGAGLVTGSYIKSGGLNFRDGSDALTVGNHLMITGGIHVDGTVQHVRFFNDLQEGSLDYLDLYSSDVSASDVMFSQMELIQ